MKNKSIILITGKLHPDVIDRFQSNKKIELLYHPDCSREKLFEMIPSAHALITRSETAIDRELLDLAGKIKVIGRAAVGIANIDVEYATEKGILVVNTPGKNTNSAAELTLAGLLSIFRNLHKANATMEQGQWNRHEFNGNELKGKTIGIVGLGNVGHRVAKFCHGFEMIVYAYDPYISLQKFQSHQVKHCESLHELLRKVDVLTVHVPLNSETKAMVGSKELAMMKTGSFVINAARGGVIEELALLAGLNSGHIRAAFIDTWEGEPQPMKELVSHPKVCASPHIGATTVEAQMAVGESIYSQVMSALEGGVVDHPVNLPQIGVLNDPLIKSFGILAERLGLMVGQLMEENPSKISLIYKGKLANLDHSLIRLAWMKGYLSCAVDSYISFVNAQATFSELGLELHEEIDPEIESFRSVLEVEVIFSNQQRLIVGGIVYDESNIRLSLIDGFVFEVEPKGNFLLVRNEDQPGVVGHIGTSLANHKINIDSFDLARRKIGGEAMALVKIDDQPSADLLKELTNLPHMIQVQTFHI